MLPPDTPRLPEVPRRRPSTQEEPKHLQENGASRGVPAPRRLFWRSGQRRCRVVVVRSRASRQCRWCVEIAHGRAAESDPPHDATRSLNPRLMATRGVRRVQSVLAHNPSGTRRQHRWRYAFRSERIRGGPDALPRGRRRPPRRSCSRQRSRYRRFAYSCASVAGRGARLMPSTRSNVSASGADQEYRYGIHNFAPSSCECQERRRENG